MRLEGGVWVGLGSQDVVVSRGRGGSGQDPSIGTLSTLNPEWLSRLSSIGNL